MYTVGSGVENEMNCKRLGLLLGTSLLSLLPGLRAQDVPTPAPAAPQSTAPAEPPAPVVPAQGTPASVPSGVQPTKGPDGTFTVRRTARLVVLDVVVTDKSGNVVTDLKKEDFHVTEQNESQTIQNFEVAGAHPVPPDAVINSTADLDRIAPRAPVNIILLDEFNTRFEDEAFARYSLKKFLERQPGKLTTPTMLIAVDIDKFMVLKDYTEDRQAILDALDHHFAAVPWRNTSRSWAGERYSTAFGTLMRVAEAVVGHPGHKTMLWIGRGFPPLALTGQVDAEQRIDNAVQQCVNLLRDARVTLYSVDPAGLLVDNSVYGMDAQFNDPFGGNYNFNKLARATGGKAFYGRNDVDAEIATGIRDGSSFYTLTYRPTNDSEDQQKFRRIKVTLERAGLTATTREGYYLARNPGRVNPENPGRRLMFDLSAALNSTMPYDGVPMTVTPGKEAGTYMVHVEPRGVNWFYATDTKPRYAEVVVAESTFDKKGKPLQEHAQNMQFKAGGDNVPPTGRFEQGLNFPIKIDMNPKAVRGRSVVRMAPTGRLGTADIDLTTPADAAASH